MPDQVLKIIQENEFFLIVDKPSGWLSVPSRDRNDPKPVLGLRLQVQINQPIWPVHRLDQEVSGLILFAKTKKAHSVANQWFESRQVEKTYEAWTEGAYEMAASVEAGTVWKSKIMKGKRRAYEADFGNEAITKVIFKGTVDWGKENLLKWEIHPETGRSHQIRFELAKRGFPIVGDKLYGSTKILEQTIALRAVGLRFKRGLMEKWGMTPDYRVSDLAQYLELLSNKNI